jgi:hypothetical protein
MKRLIQVFQYCFILGLMTFSNCNDDEEVKPQIGFAAPSSTVTEGAEIKVFFTMPLPKGVDPIFSLSGSAKQEDDFTFTVSATGLVFTVINDKVKESGETIIVTLTDFSGNARVGAEETHTITINDPPLPIVEFSATTSTAAEGGTQLVAFKTPLPDDVIPIFSAKGTATVGDDFTYSLSPLGIVIKATDDGVYDPAETIVFSLFGISDNAELGVDTIHTVTLIESPLIVEFSSPSSAVLEGGDDVTLAFNIPLPLGVLPTLSFEGTAVEGTDFTYSISSTGVILSTIADELYDPNETLIVTLTGISGNAVIGANKVHTVTITEIPLVVEFQSVSSSVLEGEEGTVAFNITVPSGATPSLSLAGTATQGADYTYTFSDTGLSFVIKDDGAYDPDETIIITLTGITGNAILGPNTVHTLTIADIPWIVEFTSASSAVTEGNNTTIAFNNPLPTGVTPTISVSGTAIQGTDYTYAITPTGLVFTTIADGLYDPNETVEVTLSAVSGNAALGALVTHTITIAEAPLVIEFAAVSSTLSEGSTTLIAFNTPLPVEVTPTISLGGTASQGSDYTYSINQNGIEITSVNDGIYDPNETIIITLTSVSGNAALGTVVTHTVTIAEPALIVEFSSASSSVAESGGNTITYNMVLPVGVTPSIELSGTATQGSDYTYTITQNGVVITTLADGIYDPNETIIVTLSGVTGNAVLGTTISHTLTITETPLAVEFASATSAIGEGSNGTVAYTLTLPAGVTPTISLGGTATQASDYTYTISQNGIVITTLADGVYDPNETIVITLTGMSGNAVLGSTLTHTVTLTEPQLIVEFTSATSSVAEGTNGTASLNIELPAGVNPSISIGGTATQGSDYTYLVTQSGVLITAINDGLYDPNETIIITLTGVSGNAVLGAIVTHTITLTESPLVVEFLSASSSLGEGNSSTLNYTITLPAGVTPIISLGGTATPGTDYTYSISENGVEITAAADGVYDPNETIIITLTGTNGNAVLGTVKTHTVTITEPPLVVEFGSASSSLGEGGSNTVTYNLTLPAGVTPTISLSGTATQGSDYTYSITQTGIQITTTSDGLYDPNETIIITLTGVSGNAVLGTVKTHTQTITESPLVVEFGSASSSLGEGGSNTASYNLTLPAGVTPTISLGGTATQGSDYTYSITQTGIQITTTADGLYDPNETIIVTLTGISGNATLGTALTHTLTVTEPPLVVEFSSATSTVGEGSSNTVTYNMILPAGVTPTVSLGGTATQGLDYTLAITQTGIQITTTSDGLYDPNETIIVTLTGVSGNAVLGTTVVHTVTINEPPLMVEFAFPSASVPEGAGSLAAFNVSLPAGVTPTISISGTATQGSDYTYTLTSAGVEIELIDDGLFDPNETIIITLTGVSGNAVLGSVLIHTITITEAPLVVEFATATSGVSEGGNGTVAYNIILPAGVTPTISLGGTATQGSDYTYTIAQNGIVILAIADGVYDPNETVIITLTGVSGNATMGTALTHTLTITEPPLVIEFGSASSSLGEGGSNTVTYNMTLPAGVTPTISLGGTATQGSDYTYSVTQTGIQITTTSDGLYDPNETIIITLTGVSGNAVLGTVKTHTLTVTEPPLVVEFSSATSTVGEGGSNTVTYNMTLPAGVTPTISLGGTATQGSDYTYSITQTGIQITTTADGLYDPNETIIITLIGVSGNAVLGTAKTHTITITEPPLVVEFSSATSTVGEGSSNTVTYNMILPAGVTPTISFGGTATQGSDYTHSITQTGIQITTTTDGLYDPNETIIVTLTGISGNATLGTALTHTLTVTEPPLVVEFSSATSTVGESSGITIPYNMTLPAGVTPTISLGGTATQGSDYTYTITQSGIQVSPVSDGLYDPNEIIIITLTAVSGNAVLGTIKTHTVTVTEPPLVVEFGSASSSLGEGGGNTATYNMTLPAGVTPTISLGGTATQGSDYTYSITQTGIQITTTSDGLYDPNETIIITLTGVSGNAVLGTVTAHTITITEPPLVVEFSSASSNVGEGSGTTISYNMTLPAGVTPTISLGGTATQGSDYTFSITPTGILITAAADGLYDPNETIIVTLTGVSGNAVLGVVKTHTVTVTEPPLSVEFFSSASSVSEGSGNTVTYNMTLPAGVTPTISLGGTATPSTDFTYTITQNGIVISTIADGLYDPNETIIITLTGVSGNAVLGTVKTHTVTVSEPPLSVEFGSASSSLGEGVVNTVTYNMTLPAGVTPTISLGGTATQGTDYTYTITQSGIQISPVADGLYDPNETIIITLTAVSGNAVLGTIKTHTVTVTEPPLVVEFGSSSSSLGEGGGNTVTYNMILPAGVTPTISLGGTATQGSDYTYSITQTGIQITTTSDGLYDPNETIIITLTGVSGNAVLGTVTAHTITITEPPLVVEFSSASSNVGEGSGTTISYNMTLPAGVTPTISLGGTATQGSDYTFSITPTGILITPAADGLYDPNETVIVTLTGVSGNATLGTALTHTLTVTEPPLVVEFSSATSTVGEGSSNAVTYNMTLPAGVTPTISLGGTATQGSDYTFAITQTGIQITTTSDGLYDHNETIIITLTAVSGNATLGTAVTHTLTITEPPLVVEFGSATSSMGEGGANTIVYNMVLPIGVTPTVSLGGTATQDVDYTYTITQNGIEISATADGLYDPDETIILTLTGVSGNAVLGTTITHTVVVSEVPLVAEFQTTASSTQEGSGSTVLYTMTLPPGVTPTISLSGTATQGSDYTFSVTQSGIEITTITDGLYEPNETILITLTGVSGNATLGTGITHTITLTEPPLIVEFTAASSTILEGQNGTVSFNMALPVEVSPTITLGGTAIQGTDYTYSITPSGIAFTVLEEWLFDPDETIIITLTGVSGNAELGTTSTHTVTITDPPSQVVEFATLSSTNNEGQSITVLYNAPLPVGVTPTLSIGGAATEGVDYTYSLTSEGIIINAIGDGVLDADETVSLTLTGFNNNEVEFGTTLTHTVTITDVSFVAEFATGSSTLVEGSGGSVAFAMALPAGVNPTLSFGGTATPGIDYTYSTSAAGLVINTLEEWSFDPDETILITLTGVSGNAQLGATVIHTVTINDSPGQIVEFASTSSTVSEGQSISVEFNSPLPGGVIPSISLGGTANTSLEYTYSFTSTGITFDILGDGVIDESETIIVTLTGFNSSDVEFGTSLSHTITITDAMFVGEFASGGSSIIEGQNGTVAFNLALPTGVNPTISLSGTATLGVDYTYSLTPAGIVFSVLEEWAFDPDETILITLTGVSGNAQLGTITTHTVTLTDPPSQVIEFTALSSTVTEGQNITVLFNTPLPAGVTPIFTLGGTATEALDYFYSISSTGIVISASGDGQFDVDETITITLTGFNSNGGELGTTINHTVTIADTPMVIGFQTASLRRVEGTAAVAAFTQQLPAGVTPIFSIGGTATDVTDYTYSNNQNGFVFTTKKDEIYDPEETAIVTLTGFTGNVVLGSVATFTLTIQDEDETASPRLTINLSWDSGNGTPGDVDMDILVWYESAPGAFTMRFLSDNSGQTFESVSIPANVENGKWGVSYVYYGGTSNNVNFTVNFRSYKGNLNGTSNRATYNQTYTLANINRWDQTQVFKIEQFYEKVANNYINFTGISVPATGSRISSPQFIIDRSLINSVKLPKVLK